MAGSLISVFENILFGDLGRWLDEESVWHVSMRTQVQIPKVPGKSRLSSMGAAKLQAAGR